MCSDLFCGGLSRGLLSGDLSVVWLRLIPSAAAIAASAAPTTAATGTAATMARRSSSYPFVARVTRLSGTPAGRARPANTTSHMVSKLERQEVSILSSGSLNIFQNKTKQVEFQRCIKLKLQRPTALLFSKRFRIILNEASILLRVQQLDLNVTKLHDINKFFIHKLFHICVQHK